MKSPTFSLSRTCFCYFLLMNLIKLLLKPPDRTVVPALHQLQAAIRKALLPQRTLVLDLGPHPLSHPQRHLRLLRSLLLLFLMLRQPVPFQPTMPPTLTLLCRQLQSPYPYVWSDWRSQHRWQSVCSTEDLLLLSVFAICTFPRRRGRRPYAAVGA